MNFKLEYIENKDDINDEFHIGQEIATMKCDTNISNSRGIWKECGEPVTHTIENHYHIDNHMQSFYCKKHYDKACNYLKKTGIYKEGK